MNARRNSRSGGVLLALAIVGGTGVGLAKGEPSIGFLAGCTAGAVLLLLVWLIDRRRTGG
jgi:hypothetical protein